MFRVLRLRKALPSAAATTGKLSEISQLPPPRFPSANNKSPDRPGSVAKAPIVGTFYAAPSPDSEPFVKVGDTVKKGDVIYIIESMKVMSEIQSDFDGVVKEILVNNGDSVEFDQPIMIIG